MRKNIIALLSITVVLFGVYACKKGAINGDKNDLISGAIITLTKNINGNLDFSKPAATVSIQVGSKGSAVESVNVYLATGDALDQTKWKLIKNVPFTDGMTLSVSTTELAAALAPAVIAPGNQYILQNEAVTKDGHKFSAVNTPTNFSSFSVYNIFFSWSATAVCAYVAPMGGNYKVVQDDWQDWSPGDIVKVTDGPKSNQLNLAQVYPNPAYGAVVDSLYIDIDPVTGAATSPKGLVWGDYGYLASNLEGSKGFVFSCTGVISLSIHIDASGYGDQGFKKLILKKQ
jgi:hypothetical protein